MYSLLSNIYFPLPSLSPLSRSFCLSFHSIFLFLILSPRPSLFPNFSFLSFSLDFFNFYFLNSNFSLLSFHCFPSFVFFLSQFLSLSLSSPTLFFCLLIGAFSPSVACCFPSRFSLSQFSSVLYFYLYLSPLYVFSLLNFSSLFTPSLSLTPCLLLFIPSSCYPLELLHFP